jgi:thioredoxin reductase (NADPH)
MGPELMDKMREQTLKYSSRIQTETVTRVDLSKRPFSVWTDGGEYAARALIIATGATAKRLGAKGEDVYWQKGISACAVCDGALPIFRDKQLVVVGGGDTACEEAIFLTSFAGTVTMVHRRDALRAQKVLQSRVFDHEKIKIVWDSIVIEAVGEQFLTGVKVQNVKDKKEKIVEAAGLFYAIGHKPNNDFIEGQLEIDKTGYIITKPDSTATSVPGVFACGDVQDKVYRQAVTAAGTGCMAAVEVGWYLSE